MVFDKLKEGFKKAGGIAKGGFKKAGGAAKGKFAKNFSELKEKYSGKKESVKGKFTSIFKKKKEEPEKQEYVESKGQMHVKSKDSDFVECDKCGLKWNKTVYSECPDCKKKKEEKKDDKKEEGDKEEEKKKEKLKIPSGGIILSILSVLGGVGGYFAVSYGGYFSEYGNLFLMIGVATAAVIMLSVFLPPKHKWASMLLWLIIVVGLGYTFGLYDEFLPEVQAQINEGTKSVSHTWQGFLCFMKTYDPNCWEPEEEEEEVTKIGNYETLTVSYGRKTSSGTIANPKPLGEHRYTWEYTLKNTNTKVYDIEIEEMHVWTFNATSTQEAEISTNEYTLKPLEELPIRARFETLPSCFNFLRFFVNVTTKQQGGGFSNFGVAPSEKGKWMTYLHYFDPRITAEPGPLDIYVFTDPYALDVEKIKTDPDYPDEFWVVIKMNNKIDGIAFLDHIYLYQTFETDSLFDVLEIECYDDMGIQENYFDTHISLVTCPDNKPGNCWDIDLTKLGFRFNISYEEVNEIACKAELTPYAKNNLNDEITDFIRVYSNYTYVQEFSQSLTCKASD